MDRALLWVADFFSDSVSDVPYGGASVRDSGLTLWAVGRGSTFEGRIIVSPPVSEKSEKVRTDVSFRECHLAAVRFCSFAGL